MTSVHAPTHSPDHSPGTTPELRHIANVGDKCRRGRFLIHRISEPGHQLSAEAQADLLVMIARESSIMFDGLDTSHYWDHRSQYFTELDEWWLAESDGRVQGWLAVALWSTPVGPVLYYDTAGIMPEARRHRLGTTLSIECFLRRVLEHHSLPPVIGRTQSPIVLHGFRQFAGHRIYPHIEADEEGAHGRAKALELARYAATRLSPARTFDEDTFVIRNAFGRHLYGGPLPLSRKPEVDAYFQTHVDTEAGDGLLFVALPDTPLMLTLLPAYVVVRIHGLIDRFRS